MHIEEKKRTQVLQETQLKLRVHISLTPPTNHQPISYKEESSRRMKKKRNIKLDENVKEILICFTFEIIIFGINYSCRRWQKMLFVVAAVDGGAGNGVSYTIMNNSCITHMFL